MQQLKRGILKLPMSTLIAVAFWATLATPAGATQLFIDPQFGVQQTMDVVYGTGLVGYTDPGGPTSTNLLADLYMPTGPGLPSELPAMVLVHGGSFLTGSKTAMSGLANDFASRGYAVIAIDYRLATDDPPPVAPFPPGDISNGFFAALEDTNLAVAWFRGEALSLGIDPLRIGLGGSSAGAVASLNVGLDPNPGSEVAAILDVSGGLFGTDALLVDPGDPPVYIAHGTDDPIVPYSEATALAAALGGAGVPFAFPVLVSSRHGTGQPSVLDLSLGSGTVRDDMFVFFRNQLAVPEPTVGVMLIAAASLARRRRRQSA